MPTSRWIRFSSICISWRSLRSRAPSGSSSSSTFGRLTIARASATRCRWPPESCAGLRSPYPSSRTIASASSARRSPRRRLPHLLHHQPVLDVPPHRHVREERVVLEDGVDRAVVRRQPRDVLPAELDRARRRASRSRRSCAASSSCPEPDGPSIVKNSPAGDLEVDRVDGDDVAVALASGPGAGCRGRFRRRRQATPPASAKPSSSSSSLDRQRRQQPDHVAVRCRTRAGAGPVRTPRRRWRFAAVGRALHELEGEHRAEAAHLADLRVPRGELVESCAYRRAERRRLGEERRDRRPRRARRPRPRTRAGCRRTCRRGPPARTASISSARPVTAASGSPPPIDFPETSRSGSTPVVVLDRPHLPGAADARLHLVVDVEDPVLTTQLQQARRDSRAASR